ncbi:unnamed protein product [Vitrella brassicaformis CCMP3155]|uniref:Uncharacterized protein n=4 Tax=Vitrella brassicaformis TaxID=1169539 RepID=A0A0G4H742_VITBC|nr:unnamed protein product [Vitrella brassicaformis CCMP3155]|eukprot:CEM39532.1 unnamed protein product [Vitrella brassicaformis CCMP3155]
MDAQRHHATGSGRTVDAGAAIHAKPDVPNLHLPSLGIGATSPPPAAHPKGHTHTVMAAPGSHQPPVASAASARMRPTGCRPPNAHGAALPAAGKAGVHAPANEATPQAAGSVRGRPIPHPIPPYDKPFARHLPPRTASASPGPVGIPAVIKTEHNSGHKKPPTQAARYSGWTPASSSLERDCLDELVAKCSSKDPDFRCICHLTDGQVRVTAADGDSCTVTLGPLATKDGGAPITIKASVSRPPLGTSPDSSWNFSTLIHKYKQVQPQLALPPLPAPGTHHHNHHHHQQQQARPPLQRDDKRVSMGKSQERGQSKEGASQRAADRPALHRPASQDSGCPSGSLTSTGRPTRNCPSVWRRDVKEEPADGSDKGQNGRGHGGVVPTQKTGGVRVKVEEGGPSRQATPQTATAPAAQKTVTGASGAGQQRQAAQAARPTPAAAMDHSRKQPPPSVFSTMPQSPTQQSQESRPRHGQQQQQQQRQGAAGASRQESLLAGRALPLQPQHASNQGPPISRPATANKSVLSAGGRGVFTVSLRPPTIDPMNLRMPMRPPPSHLATNRPPNAPSFSPPSLPPFSPPPLPMRPPMRSLRGPPRPPPAHRPPFTSNAQQTGATTAAAPSVNKEPPVCIELSDDEPDGNAAERQGRGGRGRDRGPAIDQLQDALMEGSARGRGGGVQAVISPPRPRGQQRPAERATQGAAAGGGGESASGDQAVSDLCPSEQGDRRVGWDASDILMQPQDHRHAEHRDKKVKARPTPQPPHHVAPATLKAARPSRVNLERETMRQDEAADEGAAHSPCQKQEAKVRDAGTQPRGLPAVNVAPGATAMAPLTSHGPPPSVSPQDNEQPPPMSAHQKPVLADACVGPDTAIQDHGPPEDGDAMDAEQPQPQHRSSATQAGPHDSVGASAEGERSKQPDAVEVADGLTAKGDSGGPMPTDSKDNECTEEKPNSSVDEARLPVAVGGSLEADRSVGVAVETHPDGEQPPKEPTDHPMSSRRLLEAPSAAHDGTTFTDDIPPRVPAPPPILPQSEADSKAPNSHVDALRHESSPSVDPFDSLDPPEAAHQMPVQKNASDDADTAMRGEMGHDGQRPGVGEGEGDGARDEAEAGGPDVAGKTYNLLQGALDAWEHGGASEDEEKNHRASHVGPAAPHGHMAALVRPEGCDGSAGESGQQPKADADPSPGPSGSPAPDASPKGNNGDAMTDDDDAEHAKETPGSSVAAAAAAAGGDAKQLPTEPVDRPMAADESASPPQSRDSPRPPSESPLDVDIGGGQADSDDEPIANRPKGKRLTARPDRYTPDKAAGHGEDGHGGAAGEHRDVEMADRQEDDKAASPRPNEPSPEEMAAAVAEVKDAWQAKTTDGSALYDALFAGLEADFTYNSKSKHSRAVVVEIGPFRGKVDGEHEEEFYVRAEVYQRTDRKKQWWEFGSLQSAARRTRLRIHAGFNSGVHSLVTLRGRRVLSHNPHGRRSNNSTKKGRPADGKHKLPVIDAKLAMSSQPRQRRQPHEMEQEVRDIIHKKCKASEEMFIGLECECVHNPTSHHEEAVTVIVGPFNDPILGTYHIRGEVYRNPSQSNSRWYFSKLKEKIQRAHDRARTGQSSPGGFNEVWMDGKRILVAKSDPAQRRDAAGDAGGRPTASAAAAASEAGRPASPPVQQPGAPHTAPPPRRQREAIVEEVRELWRSKSEGGIFTGDLFAGVEAYFADNSSASKHEEAVTCTIGPFHFGANRDYYVQADVHRDPSRGKEQWYNNNLRLKIQRTMKRAESWGAVGPLPSQYTVTEVKLEGDRAIQVLQETREARKGWAKEGLGGGKGTGKGGKRKGLNSGLPSSPLRRAPRSSPPTASSRLTRPKRGKTDHKRPCTSISEQVAQCQELWYRLCDPRSAEHDAAYDGLEDKARLEHNPSSSHEEAVVARIGPFGPGSDIYIEGDFHRNPSGGQHQWEVSQWLVERLREAQREEFGQLISSTDATMIVDGDQRIVRYDGSRYRRTRQTNRQIAVDEKMAASESDARSAASGHRRNGVAGGGGAGAKRGLDGGADSDLKHKKHKTGLDDTQGQPASAAASPAGGAAGGAGAASPPGTIIKKRLEELSVDEVRAVFSHLSRTRPLAAELIKYVDTQRLDGNALSSLQQSQLSTELKMEEFGLRNLLSKWINDSKRDGVEVPLS